MNLSDYLPIAGAVASDDVRSPFSSYTSSVTNILQGRGLRTVIHDALTLRGLNEMSDMNVPLRPPSSWPTECYEHYTFFNVSLPVMCVKGVVFTAFVDPQAVPYVRRTLGSHRECHLAAEVSGSSPDAAVRLICCAGISERSGTSRVSRRS
jgi:hypothetical protein